MKANELRIGNYVQRIGYPLKVTGIKGGDVWVDGNAVELEYYVYDGINPIPITEEWLVKFGFEKLNLYSLDRWIYNDFEIENMGKYFTVVVWSESCPHNTNYIGHCEYVHSLQNLYFALTGDELYIK